MTRSLRTTVFAMGFMGLGALSGLTLTAAAERGERGEHRSAMAELFEGVDLSETQKAQLMELRQQSKAERRAHREEHGGRIDLLQEMLSQDTIDRDAIYAQIEARVAERRQSALDGATTMMDFLDTLQPEQRATLTANLSEVQERMEARMDERGGPDMDEDEGDDDGRERGRRGR